MNGRAEPLLTTILQTNKIGITTQYHGKHSILLFAETILIDSTSRTTVTSSPFPDTAQKSAQCIQLHPPQGPRVAEKD